MLNKKIYLESLNESIYIRSLVKESESISDIELKDFFMKMPESTRKLFYENTSSPKGKLSKENYAKLKDGLNDFIKKTEYLSECIPNRSKNIDLIDKVDSLKNTAESLKKKLNNPTLLKAIGMFTSVSVQSQPNNGGN